MNENDIDDQPRVSPDPAESHHADLGTPDGSLRQEGTDRRKLSGAVRTSLFVAFGVVVAAALVLGGWLFVYSRTPVSVPDVVALTPAAAEQRLIAAGLKAGNARLVATKEFAAGRVIAQEPKPPATVARGSSVDVSVSVTPTALLVPDVTYLAQGAAERALRATVLVPVVLSQYSAAVPIGDVVSQLPRSGDTAFSGSNVFVVVSLGPGTKGSIVPDLVGKTTRQAASLLASQTLFPYARNVDATGAAAGTIVDQAPEPGSTVVVGSSVAIAVTAR